MHKLRRIILGTLLILLGVWGGAYFLYGLGINNWQFAPTFFTSAAIFFIGSKIVINNIDL